MLVVVAFGLGSGRSSRCGLSGLFGSGGLRSSLGLGGLCLGGDDGNNGGGARRFVMAFSTFAVGSGRGEDASL